MPTRRADASRNRAAILAAADRLFRTEGYDVPLARIAAEAGVGRTTLHRNFETRLDLALALFEDGIEELRRAAAPGDGPPPDFVELFDRLLGLFVRNGGLAEAVNIDHRSGRGLEQKREVAAILLPAARRGAEAGTVRPEAVSVEALVLLQQALTGAMLTGGGLAERESRGRLLRGILLDGLLHPAAGPLPEPGTSG